MAISPVKVLNANNPQEVDIRVLLAAIKACSRTQNVERGKQVHAQAVECGHDCNIYVANALINMYAKCGSMVDARKVFDGINHLTVVSWTALILGYASNGQGHIALDIFTKMRSESAAPNSVTLVAALKACSALAVEGLGAECRSRGKEIHSFCVQNGCSSDVYVQNSLLDMYAKCDSMTDARDVFCSIKHPDKVAWNVLILGYAQNGESDTAFGLFTRMKNEGPVPDSLTLLSVLKACTSLAVKGASRWEECRGVANEIHNIIVGGCISDVYVENTLLDMYAKCGSMVDAHAVFDRMKHTTLVSWTSLILGYAENGQGYIALDMFGRMKSEALKPDSVTFIAALKACSSIAVKEGAIQWEECRCFGKEIHNISVESGCNSNVSLQNCLLDLYAKCSSMSDAHMVFDDMKHLTVVSWTALISGYAENGHGHTALDLFNRMRIEGPAPNSVTVVAALKACSAVAVKEGTSRWLECTNVGKEIHSFAMQNGCKSDAFVQNTLLHMYSKCGSMVDAREMFDGMECKDVISWNALIAGYVENGQSQSAMCLFTRMRTEGPSPDSITLVAILTACTFITDKKATQRDRAKELENIAVENGCISNIYVQNKLVDVYAKCGNMIDAREVFDGMKRPTVISWNVLILGYAENGQGRLALDMFNRISAEGPAPDSVTVVAALKACISIAVTNGASQWAECKDMAKKIHNIASDVCNSDVYVQSTLIDIYMKCGSMVDASEVFDCIKHPVIVSWNALILGYAENGQGYTALELFSRIRAEGIAPNSATIVASLKACISLGVKETWSETRDKGKRIHNLAVEIEYNSNIQVQSTLVDMYTKCGCMVEAHTVFDGTKHPTVVSWTALILGYADSGQGHTALDMFAKMRAEGPAPDSVIYGAALKASSLVGALEFGRTIHSEIECMKDVNVVLVNCLVHFYAKCGSLVEAKSVFDSYAETRNVITWTALIAGFSTFGDTELVFGLFEGMQDAGFLPDGVTLLCILKCCSHAGLVEKGKEYFDAMITKYGVVPTLEHYSCMIDLLGRANKLDDAMALLKHMPYSPNDVSWMAILSACRKWKNVEIGKQAFQSLIDLNDRDASACVLMGQIYGSKGMLQEQEMVMRLKKSFKHSKRNINFED